MMIKKRRNRASLTALILFCTPLLWNCEGMALKVAYNNADTLVSREIDSYFDLNDEQSTFVGQKVRRMHYWHRSSQLPLYTGTLKEIKTRFELGLSQDDAQWIFQRGQIHWNALAARAYPDAVAFVELLGAEQISAFREAATESNEDLEERLELSHQERRHDRADRAMDFLEDWLGHLRDPQETELRSVNHAIRDTTNERLRMRRQRQSAFADALDAGDKESARDMLKDWFIRGQASYPDYYRAANDAWRYGATQFLVRVDASMDDEQRAYLSERLGELIADLESLQTP